MKHAAKAVSFALTLASTMSARSAESPEIPIARMALEWIKLCERPKLDSMTQWMRLQLSERASSMFPAELRARNDVGFCADNGGLRLVERSLSEPNSLSWITQGIGSGVWFDTKMIINEAGKLDRLWNMPALPPEATLPKNLADAEFAGDVKRQVVAVAKAGLFSGIVVVARGAQTLVTASAGFASRERRTAFTGSTRFTLGSLGKMFTAASIGQLVDQKKLSFGDTVGMIFPDYPNQAVREKVTVGMLLSHTAGMGDFLAKRTPQMMKDGVKRAAEFMPLFDHDAPQFEPGTRWAYSNAGLALAGAIVEKVSGEDFPDYIRRHIFAAAGMTHSDPNNIPPQAGDLVTPYTKMTPQGPSDGWHEAERDIGSPAGGAISTADDLVRFAQALRSGKLISQRTFAEMAKPHGDIPGGGKYGYAMEILDAYGKRVVGHGGGFPGVSTHLYLVLDSPYTVVVLANQDPPADAYAGMNALALTAEKAKREQ